MQSRGVMIVRVGVALLLIGTIWPQLYLPIEKWKMKWLGWLLGYEVAPKADAVLLPRLRLWCAAWAALGLLLLGWLAR